jgi:nucleoside-diphosphate-sugar epimerase
MGKMAVIGASKGIGQFLQRSFDAVSFCRGDTLEKLDGCDSFIFCAANARFRTPFDDLMAAVEDNFLLLEKVSNIPHTRFVYFSTCDVYPKNGELHREQEEIEIEDLAGGYASLKLMAEAIVISRCKSPLILRPSSLFGPGMRANNIVKMVKGQGGLTLSKNSTFNCVTYSMIADFISQANKAGLTGTFNCAAKADVSFGEIAKAMNCNARFGNHVYEVPRLDNQKISAVNSAFDRSSLEILQEYFQN